MSNLDFCGTEAPPGGAPCAGPVNAPRGIGQRAGGVPFAILALFAAFLFLPRVAASDGLRLAFGLSAGVLLAWLLVLLAVRRRLPGLFALEFVPLVKSHYIQASVQFTLYAYWGWYHRDVYAQLPLILAQLVFFYAFEALLSWSRGRAWRLGCGPLPVILSTNVFLWFKDEWFVFQFLLIAVAILGKEFIQWNRDGRRRHVFNPSAFALATFALVLLLTDTTDATWAGRIADSFDKPPSIYLVIFLLGLVVQYFFAVTLITFSAVASLCLAGLVYHQVTGTYLFVFSNIPVPVFLGLHLLVTDPATSPRSDPGKMLFGALYGLSAFALYGWLASSDAPTVYDKLLPIPLLNLAVPWIERLASRGLGAVYQRWRTSRAEGVPNLVHMGGWSVMFAVLLGTGYVQHEHEGTSYQFWRKAVEENRPYAARGLVELVKSQARGGSAAAWNELGRMHLEGKLVEQDRLKAVRYFARASKLGDLAGSANLFTLYLSSDGGFGGKVVEDALTALETACATGADGADGAFYYLVGNAYYLGAGRPVDREKAVLLFDEGARRGDPRCKGALRSLRGESRALERK